MDVQMSFCVASARDCEQVSKTSKFCSSFNYNHYTTLRYTTLHSGKLQLQLHLHCIHYTPPMTLHYTALQCTTLNYTTRRSITLYRTTLATTRARVHYTMLDWLHYTKLRPLLHHATFNALGYPRATTTTTTLHYATLHQLHYATLATLQRTKLHNTTLQYTTLH